jgi:hypothetical protein
MPTRKIRSHQVISIMHYLITYDSWIYSVLNFTKILASSSYTFHSECHELPYLSKPRYHNHSVFIKFLRQHLTQAVQFQTTEAALYCRYLLAIHIIKTYCHMNRAWGGGVCARSFLDTIRLDHRQSASTFFTNCRPVLPAQRFQNLLREQMSLTVNQKRRAAEYSA